MFELVCVTHRGLCADDLPRRVGELCRGGIHRVILREKDLPEEEYEALARQVLAKAGDRAVLHHFPQVCARLGAPRLHLSLGQLEEDPAIRDRVALLGVSIHAPEEAARALAGEGGEGGVHPGVRHRGHFAGQPGRRGPGRGGGGLPDERSHDLPPPSDLCGTAAAGCLLNPKGAAESAPFLCLCAEDPANAGTP